MNRRSFINSALVGIAAIPLLGKLVNGVESNYFKPIPTKYGRAILADRPIAYWPLDVAMPKWMVTYWPEGAERPISVVVSGENKTDAVRDFTRKCGEVLAGRIIEFTQLSSSDASSTTV